MKRDVCIANSFSIISIRPLKHQEVLRVVTLISHAPPVTKQVSMTPAVRQTVDAGAALQWPLQELQLWL